MPRTLTITIDDATGDISIDIGGYVGPACEEALKLVEEVMGRPPAEVRPKPEYQVRPASRARAGGAGSGGRRG